MELEKRNHQEIDEPTQNCINVADSMETTRPPRKLSELTEDVLHEIFSYLNATDLINLVKYDEIFLNCSRQAFQKTYRNKYIELPLKDNRISTSKEDFARNAELLTHFGKNISKMVIVLDTDNPLYRRIYQLIVKNCCDALIGIKFHWNRAALTQLTIIPKDRIERLEITSTIYTLKIWRHVAKCVNLKYLKVITTRETDTRLFDEDEWIDSTKLERLTNLEVLVELKSKQIYPITGIAIILPYLEQCKNINTAEVTVRKNGTAIEFPDTIIERMIDLEKWSFTHKTLRNGKSTVISFTLNKL